MNLRVGIFDGDGTGGGLSNLHRGLALCEKVDSFLFCEVGTTHGEPLAQVPWDQATSEGVMRGHWYSRLFPSRSPLLRAARELKLDMLVVSDIGPIMARHFTGPVVFTPFGGDLTMLPFGASLPRQVPNAEVRNARCHQGHESVSQRLSASTRHVASSTYRRLLGRRQAAGIANCTAILAPNDPPVLEAIESLRLSSRVILELQRNYLSVDTELFRPRVSFEIDENVLALLGPQEPGEIRLFHPSRFFMSRDSALVRAGQWKANDVVIEGFARATPRLRARGIYPQLILLDLPSDNSPDVESAKRMIARLGIEQHTKWVRHPEGGRMFSRHDMSHLYAASDVVADDFGVGWWGSVTLEALASGKPVLTRHDPRRERERYGKPFPAVNARNAEEFSQQFEWLALDVESRRRKGAESRAWVESEHSIEASGIRVADQLLSIWDRWSLTR